MRLLTFWNEILWQWLLPVLLTLTALVCCIRQRGYPVRGIGGVLKRTYGSLLRRGCGREQHRIFASALAATMGTGNLVGTALAIITGGAGALFWMWISALLGMILVYAENMLCSRFRQTHPDGTVTGGPAAVLRRGLHSRFAAGCFSACCIAAALGMGNLAQSSTIAQTAQEFGIPLPCTALLTALLLAVILHGGQNRIGTVAAYLMPLLCGGYLLGCTVIIVRQIHAVPDVLRQILREAFGFRAAGAGFCACMLLRTVRTGFCRGIFSNEAGLGSSPLLHLNASADDAPHQGEWAAAEVFADTLVSCTATALVILTAPADAHSCKDAAALLLQAFASGLGGTARGFLAACMILLAFATMIGWFSCGAAACRDLLGKRAAACFPFAYLLAAFAGALWNPAWIWTLCDCANGMMALPNLYALLRLSGSADTAQKKLSRGRQFDKF